jgi:hypothetical protein
VTQHTYKVDPKTSVLVTDMLRKPVGGKGKAQVRRLHFAILAGRQAVSFSLPPQPGALLEQIIGRLVKRARKAATDADRRSG